MACTLTLAVSPRRGDQFRDKPRSITRILARRIGSPSSYGQWLRHESDRDYRCNIRSRQRTDRHPLHHCTLMQKKASHATSRIALPAPGGGEREACQEDATNDLGALIKIQSIRIDFGGARNHERVASAHRPGAPHAREFVALRSCVEGGDMVHISYEDVR
jgi:hypothetical protein